MVDKAYHRTVELIAAHRDDVEKVAEFLLANEKLSREDMIQLVGARPWGEVTTFDDIIADAVVVDGDAGNGGDFDGDGDGGGGTEVDATGDGSDGSPPANNNDGQSSVVL